MDLQKKWQDSEFVAFDIETSGGYPVGDDIIEFGAVKWRGGVEIARLEFLCKPRKLMTDFIIGIHGITNSMLIEKKPFSEHLAEVREFIGESVLIAHHAPFDMGFLSWEFEQQKIAYPNNPILCSSLLARKLIRETPNHKLQTLIKFLQIEGGTAHRALADASACFQVSLECFRRAGPDFTIAQLQKIQHKSLDWKKFCIIDEEASNVEDLRQICAAISSDLRIRMVYAGGTRRGEFRLVKPTGIVRNPDGDYLYGLCMIDGVSKRFYLDKISSASLQK